ncbi:DMT family transporter [Catellatospora sp. NPDC049609]|uniref:DMT family transporter n=1 Tax=Catellatospora sp. NPDC049609 TaxID=3155505 RepID=UPI00343E8538
MGGRWRWGAQAGPTGALWCALAMVVLGASVPVSGALTGYPTALAQAARYALGAVVMLGLLALRPPPAVKVSGREWMLLATMAAVGLAGFNLALMTALRHADAAVVAAVVGCVPLALAVASALLAGRMPTRSALAAAAVVVAGTVVMHGPGAAGGAGMAAAVCALFCDVVFTLLAARLTPRLGPLRVAAYSCALAVPILAAFAVLTGEAQVWRLPSRSEATVIVFLGIVLTAGAFLAWFHGVSRLGADKAGLFVALVPTTAVAVAAVADATLPPPNVVLGVLTVGAGILAAFVRPTAVPVPLLASARPGTTALPRPAFPPALAG